MLCLNRWIAQVFLQKCLLTRNWTVGGLFAVFVRSQQRAPVGHRRNLGVGVNCRNEEEVAGWAVLAINAVLVGFPVVSGGVAQYAITANVDRHCWYRDGDCRRCCGRCGRCVMQGAHSKLVYPEHYCGNVVVVGPWTWLLTS